MSKFRLFSLLMLVVLVVSACAAPQAPTAPPPTIKPTEKRVEAATAAPAKSTATSAPAQATSTSVPTEKPIEATQVQPKVATLIFTQQFDTLSPLYTNMFFSQITHQFWNCWAWDFDENNQPRPVLIKEMPSMTNGGISSDGKIITLKLRDDIAWSDGQPITAEDFIFTNQMYMDPKNTVATTYPYDQIDTIEAPDPQTVVMTFKEPFAPWLFFWHGMIPAHILKPVFEKDGTLDNAEWNKAPTVGCGPFVFQEWQTGSFARFVANENYWLGRPKLNELFIRFVPDDASQVAALKAGDGDLGIFISYPDIPALEESGVQIVKVFSGYNEGIYINTTEQGHPALKDERVRQALAYATNRQEITEKLLLGKTIPAATFWDNTPYADPSIQPYPFNVEQANQLLDEAGWKDSNGDGTRDRDGVELVLKYGTTTKEVRQDTQAVIQQQLATVGIKTDLLNYESDLFFDTYGNGGPAATGQLDIMEWSDVPAAFPDPDTAYWACAEIPTDEAPQGVNWTGTCDEELDKLFALQKNQVDFATRQATFRQISQLMFEKVYWLGLWQDPDQYAVGKRLVDVKLSGATPFFNVMDWNLNP